MTTTLTVSSSEPTLLFEDTTTGPPAHLDFQFVLDNRDFSLQAEKAGGGWAEVFMFTQTTNECVFADSLVIENSSGAARLDLCYYEGGGGTSYYWRLQVSTSGTLEFECERPTPQPCFRLEKDGTFDLRNDGTYQTKFLQAGPLTFVQKSGGVDIMRFQFGGVTKAHIASDGCGEFGAVQCGGGSSAPTATGRYLGELWLQEPGFGTAILWAWVPTGASTEGWRGVELS